MTCITVNIVIITIGFFFFKFMAHLKIEVSVHPSFLACFIFPSSSAKPEDTQITLVKNRGSNLQAFALFTFFWLNSVSWLIDWITECFSQAAWLKICCEEPEMLHLPEHIRSRWPWVKNSIWGPSGSSAKCLRMRSKLLPLEVATTTCVRFSEVTEKRLSFYNKPRDVSRS